MVFLHRMICIKISHKSIKSKRIICSNIWAYWSHSIQSPHWVELNCWNLQQVERSWHSHIPSCPSLWSQLWSYLLLYLGSLQLEYHMPTAHCQGFSTSHPSAPVEILEFTWYWAPGTEDQDIRLRKTVKQCSWLLGGTMNRRSTWLWTVKTVSAQWNCAKGGDASSSELSLVSPTLAYLFLVNGYLCIGITKSTETISSCHTLRHFLRDWRNT